MLGWWWRCWKYGNVRYGSCFKMGSQIYWIFWWGQKSNYYFWWIRWKCINWSFTCVSSFRSKKTNKIVISVSGFNKNFPWNQFQEKFRENDFHCYSFRAFFKRLLANPDLLYLPGHLTRNRKFMPGNGPKKWIARTMTLGIPRTGSIASKMYLYWILQKLLVIIQ